MRYMKLLSYAKTMITTTCLLLLLSSCATAPTPLPSTGPGKGIDTLQSEVTLSLRTGEKSIGGRGYLLFKRPDRFHLAVLSPFGFTLMDVFVADDQITCVVPAKQTAYQGRISELPDQNALKGWGMMRWVVDTPPTANGAGLQEYLSATGRRELLEYDERGLLIAKTNDDGDRVTYHEYHDRNGVAFPSAIEMNNALGDTVRIVFDEPEVNQPIEETALTPILDGMQVLPLAAFKGL